MTTNGTTHVVDEKSDRADKADKQALKASAAEGAVVPAPAAATPATGVAPKASASKKSTRQPTVVGTAGAKALLSGADLANALAAEREDIIQNQLPPEIPEPVKMILRKIAPTEILVLKAFFEMIYGQAMDAGNQAVAEAFQKGDETGLARGKAGMLATFKPLISVVNAADAWVDNTPKVEGGKLVNGEAAQAATVALVQAVIQWRQTRPPASGAGAPNGVPTT